MATEERGRARENEEGGSDERQSLGAKRTTSGTIFPAEHAIFPRRDTRARAICALSRAHPRANTREEADACTSRSGDFNPFHNRLRTSDARDKAEGRFRNAYSALRRRRRCLRSASRPLRRGVNKMEKIKMKERENIRMLPTRDVLLRWRNQRARASGRR